MVHVNRLTQRFRLSNNEQQAVSARFRVILQMVGLMRLNNLPHSVCKTPKAIRATNHITNPTDKLHHCSLLCATQLPVCAIR